MRKKVMLNKWEKRVPALKINSDLSLKSCTQQAAAWTSSVLLFFYDILLIWFFLPLCLFPGLLIAQILRPKDDYRRFWYYVSIEIYWTSCWWLWVQNWSSISRKKASSTAHWGHWLSLAYKLNEKRKRTFCCIIQICHKLLKLFVKAVLILRVRRNSCYEML